VKKYFQVFMDSKFNFSIGNVRLLGVKRPLTIPLKN